MMHRWLKSCPRCRSNELLETKDDCRHAVRCVRCGYLLLLDEVRFLIEDVIRVSESERTAA
jgi:hypothetical protein